MLQNLPGYRTALYLSIALVPANLVAWAVIFGQAPHVSKTAVWVLLVPVAISVGLWLQSIFITVLGALWMLIWAGGLAWPVISEMSQASFRPVMFVVFLLCAILNLLTAGTIILSKKFRAEFTHERKHQPRYKSVSRWLVFTALILAMVIATFNDMLRVAVIK
jgi:hypothetical protein